ncbi:MAG: bacteriohemerythrin [Pseudomonadota bacterium]
MSNDQLIDWSTELEMGIHEIDEQHRMLVDILNEFYEAIQQHKGTAVAEGILERLADYTRIHFAVEESMMRLLDYPDYQEHKRLHDELIETLKDLTVKFASGKRSVNFELIHFLKLWLTKHIQESDMDYTAYFLSRGVVAQPNHSLEQGNKGEGFSIKNMWSKLWRE